MLDSGSSQKKSRNVGTVFSGSVSYQDSDYNRQRKTADGSFTFRNKKGEDIEESEFDHSSAQADVAINKFKAPVEQADPEPAVPGIPDSDDIPS